MSYPRLEGLPSDTQKRRLEDWLTELKIICRRYRILLEAEDGEVRLIDLDRRTTIGLGLTYQTAERAGREWITACDATGSILDGVWLIDTPNGPEEQLRAGHVWPAPTQEES